MSDERPDLAPDPSERTPTGYVQVPGGGQVHVAVLAAVGVLAWLVWKWTK